MIETIQNNVIFNDLNNMNYALIEIWIYAKEYEFLSWNMKMRGSGLAALQLLLEFWCDRVVPTCPYILIAKVLYSYLVNAQVNTNLSGL